MSFGKEAPRILCLRKLRTCTSLSDAESEHRASTVDDGGAFEEDAERCRRRGSRRRFMRLDVKEELAGSSGSNGDGVHASVGKRRLQTESNPTMVKASKEELFTIGSMRVMFD